MFHHLVYFERIISNLLPDAFSLHDHQFLINFPGSTILGSFQGQSVISQNFSNLFAQSGAEGAKHIHELLRLLY